MMPTLAHIALSINEQANTHYTAQDVAVAARARGLRPVDGRLDEDAIPHVRAELRIMERAGTLPSAPYGLSDHIFAQQEVHPTHDPSHHLSNGRAPQTF